MIRTARIVLAAGLVAAAALGAASANAQVYGSINIGVPLPPVAVVPPPPVFVPRPMVVAPRPVYGPPPAYYYRDRGHYHRQYNARRWDRDGDGVPNRHDRRPGNPYRY
ncbi:hypothetical protein QTH91_20910 [Variovorax dokdonensis]|uniref:Uncharacterized protein n=1 Tax=Variovorax dokdonensis TaxID=344883 RepID=A0ABT7NG87_9BURK|nr:hypothetical protein [Variovorax dokdonensis]MDM0046965.1 hypothetical protein [Variovorax dokdonensis]